MSLLAYCRVPRGRSIVRHTGHGSYGAKDGPGFCGRAKDVDPLQRG
jgi:hypothetical protein